MLHENCIGAIKYGAISTNNAPCLLDKFGVRFQIDLKIDNVTDVTVTRLAPTDG